MEAEKTTKPEQTTFSRKYCDRRSREYLLESEVESVISAAKKSRHGLRDSTLILLSYRHGLRVSEAVNLKWEDLDLILGTIHINRLKRGKSGRHPLKKVEIIALNRLRKQATKESRYVFTSQLGLPLSDRAVGKIIENAGKTAGLPFPIHPHMMRHSCGYFLANQGIDTRAIAEYLGHTSLNNSYRYTAIAPGRFEDFWSD